MILIIPNYSPGLASETYAQSMGRDQGATFKISMVWKPHMKNMSRDALVMGSWAMRADVVCVTQNSDRYCGGKSMHSVT